MLFHEYGDKQNPPVLLLHGMLQDWRSEYEMLKPLEAYYRLIVPAMDGMYEGAPEFTSFADQCKQIERYVIEHYNGKLHGVCGASQGATVLSELLARNYLNIKTAVLDGIYLARQGKIAAYYGYYMFKKVKENGGIFPKSMDVVMKLMGLSKEAYVMFENIYWDVSLISMKQSLLENYTYRVNPAIKKSNTKVYLWCGEKEPYALKSHRIIKPYLYDFEETVFHGMGHGEMLMFHQTEYCEMIRKAIG